MPPVKKLSKNTLGWYKSFLVFSGKLTKGFYYSIMIKPKWVASFLLSVKQDQHKLYYHKLGTSQKMRINLWRLYYSCWKHRYVKCTVSGRWSLFVYISKNIWLRRSNFLMRGFIWSKWLLCNYFRRHFYDSYVVWKCKVQIVYNDQQRRHPTKK